MAAKTLVDFSKEMGDVNKKVGPHWREDAADWVNEESLEGNVEKCMKGKQPEVQLKRVDESEVEHGEHNNEDSSETMDDNVVEKKPLIERAREEPELYGPLLAYAAFHDKAKYGPAINSMAREDPQRYGPILKVLSEISRSEKRHSEYVESSKTNAKEDEKMNRDGDDQGVDVGSGKSAN